MRLPCCARRLLVVASIPLLIPASASQALAHAFVQRYDLPVPFWYYLVGAALVVTLTFVMLAAVRADALGRCLAVVDLSRTVPGRIAGSGGFQRVLAIVSVVVFVFLLVAGLLGTQEDPFANILPVFVWVGWWVGFAFVCALVGNVWPAINPWVSVWRLFGGGNGNGRANRTPPSWLGVWPAVVLYLCFVWTELIWPDNTVPAKLATLILIYSGITWAGMLRYGAEPWLRCGETFSIVFDLFGRFAPVGRQADGRLVLRLYGAGLVTAKKVSVSMLVFVVVLLASVSFDGFLHTPTWGHIYAGASHALYDLGAIGFLGNTGARTLILTGGLVGASVCFVLTFLSICKVMAMLRCRDSTARPSALDVASHYALSLVPIAIAYHLAHYFLLLVIEGQRLYGEVSDPLGFGWDLFGTAGTTPDQSIVDARFLWLFSLLVIVMGHAIAVWLSHMTAQRESTNRREILLPQIPMLFLMIGYTMLSLWIIGQPIVEV